MNLLPNSIADHETLWLDMLADNELDSNQRQRFFAYLDQTTDGWKRCAQWLLHEQLLAIELKQAACDRARDAVPIKDMNFAAASKDQAQLAPRATGGRRQRTLVQLVLTACVAFAMGLGLYPLLSQSPTSAVSDQSANNAEAPGSAASKAYIESRMVPASLNTELPGHTLYEIENTLTHATYYLNHQLPEFLLQSLVLAGHTVQVDQDLIAIPGPDGQLLQVPMNKLEVTKFTQYDFSRREK